MAKIRDFNSTLMESAGNWAVKIDEVNSTTTYIGKAEHGTETSSPLWQIQKISEVGNVTTISFADATDSFSKIWDNRSGYSY